MTFADLRPGSRFILKYANPPSDLTSCHQRFLMEKLARPHVVETSKTRREFWAKKVTNGEYVLLAGGRNILEII